MAHGVKPYGRTEAQQTIFGVQDMGELAARLWSPNTHDRRGDTLFMDSFDSGLQGWDETVIGPASAVNWVSTHSRSGGFCCELVAGNVIGNYAQISKTFPYTRLSNIGVEFHWSTDDVPQRILVIVSIYDMVDLLQLSIAYDRTTQDLLWMDQWAAYPALDPNIPTQNDDYDFHALKLVSDLPNREYERVLFDNREYIMTGFFPVDNPFGGIPRVAVTIRNWTWSANVASQVYIDDFILTQNEPPNP